MLQPAKLRELLRNKPAQFIMQQIKEFARTSPCNHLSFMNGYDMWGEPMVKFANGYDPIFKKYKDIISPNHFTPQEAFAKAFNKSVEEIQVPLSVISYILPISEETRKSNRTETRVPSRFWSHTSWYGERFNEKLRSYLVDLLSIAGYMAVAPALGPYFKEYRNESGLYSNWSERHIAYAAGHGTFSLSDGIITERGIAIKCGSVITNLILPISHRADRSPYSNCLFYQGINCKSCINRCPAAAITEKGHDKNKCYQYLCDMGYIPAQIEIDGYDNDKTLAGCGLCQTKVPCEFQNPSKKIKKKTGN